MNKTKLAFIYEIFMLLLALISVSFIWIANPSLHYVDTIVWLIFVLDVSVRFFRSESKWEYIKKHPLDIIAIIPFDSIFLFARFARIFRLIRLIAMASHFAKPIFSIIQTNGLHKMITFTCGLIFISAIPIYLIEPKINTYQDALWWSIVTATTVGYGDLSPATLAGRLIAILLMIFGIGLIGMTTGSIATYFISHTKETNSTVAFIKQELDRYDQLSEADIETLQILLEKLKTEKAQI
ncbi:two pore domain potassium channel family protein [Paenibacillus psychroresistens]|uniref:Two pore domain potassium channel family protein n=1 Tax=Paenibacillus psychroresistens TaxID=1778678 RepID=A0A6B8RLR8_9BACL|nr:potassium channel family protein [Paenibacillus psychroresistens]QGQ96787.1 two pore domain potassium channel family protein [Paenibacillus psychroresistens]